MSLTIYKNIEDSNTILDCYGGGMWEFNSDELISFLKILDMTCQHFFGQFFTEQYI